MALSRQLLSSTIVAMAFLGTPSVMAELDGDQARKLCDEGHILSVKQLVQRVSEIQPGRLIETELEEEDGIYVYEFSILDADGVVWEVELDAVSGELLELEKDH